MAVAHKPSKRVVERRKGFQRYKRDVQDRGKPFYPFAMFHDTVMSLVVVSVIVVLAVIWKYTAGEAPDDSGWLGPLYKEKADPGRRASSRARTGTSTSSSTCSGSSNGRSR